MGVRPGGARQGSLLGPATAGALHERSLGDLLSPPPRRQGHLHLGLGDAAHASRDAAAWPQSDELGVDPARLRRGAPVPAPQPGEVGAAGREPTAAGVSAARGVRGGRAMSWGLIQHDFDGEPLFQHRNQAKWVLRGENPPLPGFQLHEACVAALADLARRWRGRIEPLPARTSADLEAEAELASARLFVLDRGGSDSSELELLVANRIGDGRCDARQRWFVADGTLVLDGLRGPSARLRLDDDGVWRGRSLEPGGQPLVLVPLACSPQDPLAVVIAALLERVVANEVPADDAVATVVTLGALGDLSPLLVRERARWPENSLAARTIDRARWRLGRRNPSLRANDGGDARRYAPA